MVCGEERAAEERFGGSVVGGCVEGCYADGESACDDCVTGE